MGVPRKAVTDGAGNLNAALTIVQSSSTYISGTASGSPDPYSYVTSNTSSVVQTESGDTTNTLDEAEPFSYGGSNSATDVYTISGPPASTLTDEVTSSSTESGSAPTLPLPGGVIPAYWDTSATELAKTVGSSSPNSPIQDGTSDVPWDTSQGLVSALGGQDMHALQSTGAEIQPALSGSSIALEEGGGGSGTWASHPSAIGYRRQGYLPHSGSGAGSSTVIRRYLPSLTAA